MLFFYKTQYSVRCICTLYSKTFFPTWKQFWTSDPDGQHGWKGEVFQKSTSVQTMEGEAFKRSTSILMVEGETFQRSTSVMPASGRKCFTHYWMGRLLTDDGSKTNSLSAWQCVSHWYLEILILLPKLSLSERSLHCVGGGVTGVKG